MNNKGFTLMEILAVLVIMGVILAILIPSITGVRSRGEKQKYSVIEKSMVEYSKAYFDDEIGFINLEDLKNKGLTKVDNDCIGYVDLNTKTAYLKCSDYETTGFDINKLN